MKRSVAIEISNLAGNMVVAFLKHLGPIPEHSEYTDREKAFNELCSLRQQISDVLVENIDEEKESIWKRLKKAIQ